MKKVLLALCVTALFAACNGGSSTTETSKDSTTVTTDTSSKMAPAVADTTMKDSTHMMSTDTTKK